MFNTIMILTSNLHYFHTFLFAFQEEEIDQKGDMHKIKIDRPFAYNVKRSKVPLTKKKIR